MTLRPEKTIFLTMPMPVVITLIICGTIIVVTLMALIFAAWVIKKGVEISERKGE